MKLISLICLILTYSLISHEGVFGASPKKTHLVISPEQNMCGVFTPGTAESPNWLPDGWQAALFSSEVAPGFLQNTNCKTGNIEYCCRENGFRYAGKPVGVSRVSEERYAAEMLAGKGIIASRSLHPDAYHLSAPITRKELMKIIMNASEQPLNTSCEFHFSDVQNDWGCPYIESALEYGFIADNPEFRPDESVTRSEALKLIFQARGIQSRYDTHHWQEDYISSAYYLGYIDEKFSAYNMPATRGWIFVVLQRTY